MTSVHRNRICALVVEGNQAAFTRVQRECDIAIGDLLDENAFELVGRDCGPYRLTLSTGGPRLGFNVHTEDGTPIVSHLMSFTPLRRAIEDYVMICGVYEAAGVRRDPYRLEAIDMARRAAHDEGSTLLRSRLVSKIDVDHRTARGLFTLVALSRTVTIDQ